MKLSCFISTCVDVQHAMWQYRATSAASCSIGAADAARHISLLAEHPVLNLPAEAALEAEDAAEFAAEAADEAPAAAAAVEIVVVTVEMAVATALAAAVAADEAPAAPKTLLCELTAGMQKRSCRRNGKNLANTWKEHGDSTKCQAQHIPGMSWEQHVPSRCLSQHASAVKRIAQGGCTHMTRSPMQQLRPLLQRSRRLPPKPKPRQPRMHRRMWRRRWRRRRRCSWQRLLLPPQPV